MPTDIDSAETASTPTTDGVTVDRRAEVAPSPPARTQPKGVRSGGRHPEQTSPVAEYPTDRYRLVAPYTRF